MIPTPLDMAWAAGLFEGEGTIRIAGHYRKSRTNGHYCQMYILDIAVTMTDESSVKELHTLFGGWFGNHHPQRGRHRRSYIWRVTSVQAGEFLRVMLPYFRSERVRNKTILALEFQNQKLHGTGRLVPGYSDRQAEYYQRMKFLNLRGVQEPSEVA